MKMKAKPWRSVLALQGVRSALATIGKNRMFEKNGQNPSVAIKRLHTEVKQPTVPAAPVMAANDYGVELPRSQTESELATVPGPGPRP